MLLTYAFVLAVSDAVSAEEKADDKKKTTVAKAAIHLSIRAEEYQGGSRILINNLPSDYYQPIPGVRDIQIQLYSMGGVFSEADLLAIRNMNYIARISAQPIEDDPDKTIFKVEFNCACQADIYSPLQGVMVVDVYDDTLVENPKRYHPDHEQEIVLFNQPPSESEKKEPKEAKQEVVADQEDTKKIAGVLLPPAVENRPDMQAVYKDEDGEKFDIADADSDEVLRNKLTDILKQAAQTGLVSYQKPEVVEEKNELPEEAAAQNAQALQQDNILTMQTDNKNPKDISSSEQRVMREWWKKALAQKKCLPDAAFYLQPNKYKKNDYYDIISQHRDNLLGEFDEVDPSVALKLAGAYISYGLGDEAVNLLENIPALGEMGFVYQEMASLFTTRNPPKNSMFSYASDCKGLHRLWGAYWNARRGYQGKAADLADFPGAEVLLSSVPEIIRVPVAGKLAQALVRHGRLKHAEHFAKSLAMLVTPFDPIVLLVNGLIDVQEGLPSRALNKLEKAIARSITDQGDIAMALAELKMAQNVTLNDEDLVRLEGVAFLYDRELVGALALNLIVEYLARQGDFHTAFLRLDDSAYIDPNDPDNPGMMKAKSLFKRLAISGEGMGNPENIMVFWDYPHLIPDNKIMIQNFAEGMASRGYYQAATQIIDMLMAKYPAWSKKKNLLLKKADYLLQLRKPAAAMQVMHAHELTGEPEEKALLARILQDLYRPKQAFDVLVSDDDPVLHAPTLQQAFTAYNWDSLAYLPPIADESEKEFRLRQAAGYFMIGKPMPNLTEEEQLQEKDNPNKARAFFKSQSVPPDYSMPSIQKVIDETDQVISFMREEAML